MRWSLRLASIAGIGVYIHWSFLILIGWVIYVNAGSGATAVATAVGFTLAIFLCIVLHELGHAMAARRYGIRTRDITLLPIGGLARLERMPEDPAQELFVAIAGPLVNVVIAAALAAGLAIGGRLPRSPEELVALMDPAMSPGITGFLLQLLAVNIFLVLFNMLPAIPMDGGRVLRALLGFITDHAKATRIASTIGQAAAVLFAIAGLFAHQPMLMLIGVFVFFGAQSEAHVAQVRRGLAGIPVREAMLTRFTALSETDTLAAASDLLLAGSQQDFPVMRDDQVVGVLPRADLIRALAQRGPTAPVSEFMRAPCPPVQDTDRLAQVVERMQASSCALVPVLRRGRLVGLVTPENVGEFLMIRQAMGKSPSQAPSRPA